MIQLCESIMLVCFGISWPISVYKSIKTRSTKGKSVVFLAAIIIGYIAGITGKVLHIIETGEVPYSLYFYILNICVVSTDFVLYFINRSREKKAV